MAPFDAFVVGLRAIGLWSVAGDTWVLFSWSKLAPTCIELALGLVLTVGARRLGTWLRRNLGPG